MSERQREREREREKERERESERVSERERDENMLVSGYHTHALQVRIVYD